MRRNGVQLTPSTLMAAAAEVVRVCLWEEGQDVVMETQTNAATVMCTPTLQR